jgi:hypothetical protein
MPRKPSPRAQKPATPRKRSSRARKPATPRKPLPRARKAATQRNPLPRVRKLALSLPEAHEVEAWGEPTFRVKNKIFAMYARANNHHGGGRNAVWCKAKPVNQSLMIGASPDRFFSPPYVGPSGWIGVWLDSDVNWEELLDLLTDGYRMTAPKKVLAQLEDS